MGSQSNTTTHTSAHANTSTRTPLTPSAGADYGRQPSNRGSEEEDEDEGYEGEDEPYVDEDDKSQAKRNKPASSSAGQSTSVVQLNVPYQDSTSFDHIKIIITCIPKLVKCVK